MMHAHLDAQLDALLRMHGLESVLRTLAETCLNRANHGPVDEETAERWSIVGLEVGYLAADCKGLK